MQKKTTSGNAAVEDFLECVGRCLAQRWWKLQHGNSQVEHPSDHLITPTSADQQSPSKSGVGKRHK